VEAHADAVVIDGCQDLDVVKEATVEDYPAAQYLVGAPALPPDGTPVNREKFGGKVREFQFLPLL